MYSEVVDNGEYEGKKYGAPFYVSKTLLFLNQVMMKEAVFNTPECVSLVERRADLTKRGVINKISWTGRQVKPDGAFAGNVGMLQAHAPA